MAPKVKESGPKKPRLGVYVAVQPLIETVPLGGWVTTWQMRGSGRLSGSEQERGKVLEVL